MINFDFKDMTKEQANLYATTKQPLVKHSKNNFSQGIVILIENLVLYNTNILVIIYYVFLIKKKNENYFIN